MSQISSSMAMAASVTQKLRHLKNGVDRANLSRNEPASLAADATSVNGPADAADQKHPKKPIQTDSRPKRSIARTEATHKDTKNDAKNDRSNSIRMLEQQRLKAIAQYEAIPEQLKSIRLAFYIDIEGLDDKIQRLSNTSR